MPTQISAEEASFAKFRTIKQKKSAGNSSHACKLLRFWLLCQIKRERDDVDRGMTPIMVED
jgi:hypothetical protein